MKILYRHRVKNIKFLYFRNSFESNLTLKDTSKILLESQATSLTERINTIIQSNSNPQILNEVNSCSQKVNAVLDSIQNNFEINHQEIISKIFNSIEKILDRISPETNTHISSNAIINVDANINTNVPHQNLNEDTSEVLQTTSIKNVSKTAGVRMAQMAMQIRQGGDFYTEAIEYLDKITQDLKHSQSPQINIAEFQQKLLAIFFEQTDINLNDFPNFKLLQKNLKKRKPKIPEMITQIQMLKFEITALSVISDASSFQIQDLDYRAFAVHTKDLFETKKLSKFISEADYCLLQIFGVQNIQLYKTKSRKKTPEVMAKGFAGKWIPYKEILDQIKYRLYQKNKIFFHPVFGHFKSGETINYKGQMRQITGLSGNGGLILQNLKNNHSFAISGQGVLTHLSHVIGRTREDLEIQSQLITKPPNPITQAVENMPLQIEWKPEYSRIEQSNFPTTETIQLGPLPQHNFNTYKKVQAEKTTIIDPITNAALQEHSLLEYKPFGNISPVLDELQSVLSQMHKNPSLNQNIESNTDSSPNVNRKLYINEKIDQSALQTILSNLQNFDIDSLEEHVNLDNLNIQVKTLMLNIGNISAHFSYFAYLNSLAPLLKNIKQELFRIIHVIETKIGETNLEKSAQIMKSKNEFIDQSQNGHSAELEHLKHQLSLCKFYEKNRKTSINCRIKVLKNLLENDSTDQFDQTVIINASKNLETLVQNRLSCKFWQIKQKHKIENQIQNVFTNLLQAIPNNLKGSLGMHVRRIEYALKTKDWNQILSDIQNLQNDTNSINLNYSEPTNNSIEYGPNVHINEDLLSPEIIDQTTFEISFYFMLTIVAANNYQINVSKIENTRYLEILNNIGLSHTTVKKNPASLLRILAPN